MIGRPLHFAVGLACLFAANDARAGAIGPCDEPYAFESAVNVYFLEDAEQGADERLRDVRKRLAWLVTLDTLFHDSYGSLGVHFLWQYLDREPCTLDSVVRSAVRVMPSGGGAAFVDYRIYREGDQILLQSYLFFGRFYSERLRPETVEFGLSPDLLGFSELLPTQRVAFPPRQLTTDDLSEIEDAFADASILYAEPNAPGGNELPISAEQPLPFLVTEVRRDGWMHVDATQFDSDLKGWLRVDPKVSARLRALLPELDFLEGTIGYLSWLQVRDGWRLERETAAGAARRASELLDRYVKTASVAEDLGPSLALAGALRAAMVLDDPARAGALLPPFVEIVQRSLPDSRLRGLLGITRLAACCRDVSAPDSPSRRAVRIVGLAGALNDFQAALAIDPGNLRGLANLEAIYTTLGKSTEYPIPAQAPANAVQALHEAYARALTHLPATRVELDSRIAEIRVLRTALPIAR